MVEENNNNNNNNNENQGRIEVMICPKCKLVILNNIKIEEEIFGFMTKKRCYTCEYTYKWYPLYVRLKNGEEMWRIKAIDKEQLLKPRKLKTDRFVFFIRNNLMIRIVYVTNDSFFIELLHENYDKETGRIISMEWVSGRHYFIKDFVEFLN